MKSKKIICPVCGEYTFDINLPISKNQNTPFCHVCGWDFDERQIKSPNMCFDGKISLNDFRKSFLKFKKENTSNYFFVKDKDNDNNDKPHQCPVCHEYTFPCEESYDICPICGWEDDNVQEAGPNYKGGANDLSLNQMRAIFRKKRKKNSKYKWEHENNR